MPPDPQPDVDRIVADLRAALEAVEATARVASQGTWVVGRTAYAEGEMYGSHISVLGRKPGQIADMRWSRDSERVANAEHITRHDPAWVLNLVAAHRELLADLLAEQHRACAMTPDGQGACTCGRDQRVLRRVRVIAAAYAGRGERNVRDVLDRDEEG